MESILTSIKKLLGLEEEQKDFDPDIIMYINSVFPTLNQLGVGPKEGFSITDELALWSEFIQDNKKLNDVKTYIYLKVKLIFDPPLSSSVLASTERMIKECEWRLNITAESEPYDDSKEEQDGIFKFWK